MYLRYLIQSIKQALRSAWKKLSRKAFKLMLFTLPETRKVNAERWWRGREQYQTLMHSDVAVVSFGKSGRTWLRVMLSRMYQQMYFLPEKAVIGFDNFHGMQREIPKIFFTHDNYIKDFTHNVDNKSDFYNKKVILLARDPRDITVSQFFQWKHRMKSYKKVLNQYPPESEDVSIYDFMLDENAGLPKIIEFLNIWASEKDKLNDFLLVRYEDLKQQPHKILKDIAKFLGAEANNACIEEAVEYSSYENMKKMEQSRTFWLSGGRLVPRDKNNPDSYKVRRAKVGGYKDYFSKEQIEMIDALVNVQVNPMFGYTDDVRNSVQKEANSQ